MSVLTALVLLSGSTGGAGLVKSGATKGRVWSQRSPPPSRHAAGQLGQQRLSFRRLPGHPQSRKLDMLHADVRVLEKVRLPVRELEQLGREATSVEQSTDASRGASTHGPIIPRSRPNSG